MPFSCAGRDYTLKIDEMKQLNNETKTERDVRRNKPGSHPGKLIEIKYTDDR